jgi:DNA mismatch repair protein MutL
MSKIRILPEQLANQIAAGEVVERPASVVKELLENSLDAKAGRIEIEIEGGGTRLIRVIDDGIGMDEDDLLLCLERHGTSKIATEPDLAAIATLGFRGEAIPSIGSVSRLTLTSRPADSPLGSTVVLDYGKLTKVQQIGSSIGTTCEIRNLFGNTPARRKFLRTSRTELGHIEEVVKNYALGSPAATLILRVDGREVLSLDRTLSIAQRLAAILHYEGPFLEIATGAPGASGRTVSGFLIPPERVTIGPARLRLFVNGRAIRDRMIVHGVTEGMRGFLMKGKNPSGLIHLTLPPDEVDVNVHPAKHEVRFRNSREIHDLLNQAVAKALHNHQAALQGIIFGRNRTIETTAIPLNADVAQSPPFFDQDDPPTDNRDSRPRRESAPSSPPPVPNQGAATTARPRSLLITAEPLPNGSEGRGRHAPPQPDRPVEPRPAGHNLLIIGQYDNLYIFCRSDEGLLVIDQHAAHERLLYEKLRRQYRAGTLARQVLMFPETVELSNFQAQLVEKNGEEIDRMGFTIGDFGGNTSIISTVPALAGTTDPRELFLGVLEQFGSESGGSDRGGFLEGILAAMACKAAVKAGTALSYPEIDKLLDEMARADLFSHCPHGRPVVKRFTGEEIKKWFYRT